MNVQPARESASIPVTSLIFGYGPMLPLMIAAAGAWLLPAPWPDIALRLALIWGGAILIFVAGVRRGYGFGAAGASTVIEIVTMLAYFIPGSLALGLAMFGRADVALPLLMVGFALVALLDRHAGRTGDAPRHFARLRLPQMSIAVVALGMLWLAAR